LSHLEELDLASQSFHEVVHIPVEPVLLDLTGTEPERAEQEAIWTVGRYDEKRIGYTADLFAGGRCIHIGIDIGGPIGTPVMAFADGIIFAAGYNPAPGDYGHVVVTEHHLAGGTIWALHGHLDTASSSTAVTGASFSAGDVLGRFGDRHENGGWPPHLHFQLSLVEPDGHDMPGVVTEADRVSALAIHPDPRLVLGPLY